MMLKWLIKGAVLTAGAGLALFAIKRAEEKEANQGLPALPSTSGDEPEVNTDPSGEDQK